MTRISVAGILLLAVAAMPAAQPVQSGAMLSIVPQPVRLARHDGSLVLSPRTEIHVTSATRDRGYRLADYIAPATGLRLPVRVGAAAASAIVLRVDGQATSLGPEGYRREVARGAVTIRGGGPAGVFYGMQTLRQLLAPDVFRAAQPAGAAWEIPAVSIEDSPRFGWRGAMLDVSRHFMPKEFVKKFIDLLALHKMNSFHWHLTDHQGWRIEIKRYPRLTEVGAWRSDPIVGKPPKEPTPNELDHLRPGGFLAQG